MVLALELRIEEKNYRRKSTEARDVAVVSLSRGLVERPLHEAVKLKLGLPWRSQDVEILESGGTC